MKSTILLIAAYIVYASLIGWLAAVVGTAIETTRRMYIGKTYNPHCIHPMWYFVNCLFFGLPLYFVGGYVYEHGNILANQIILWINSLIGFLLGILAEKNRRNFG